MMKWVPYAFVRITLFFVAGILSAIYLGASVSREVSLMVSLILLIVYGACWIRLKSKNLFLSFIGFALLFALGFTNLKLATQHLNSDHISHYDEYSHLTATVRSDPYETAKTLRYELLVDQRYDSGWYPTSGKFFLYVSKAAKEQYGYGDRLLINAKLRPLTEPANPGEFDYKRFLSFKNIYHQLYSKGNDIKKLEGFDGYLLLKLAYEARHWATDVLQSAITSEREANIALALILGVKDGLTDEIKNAYSASGAMHVLAVSGLHVGIIYMLFTLLLGRIKKTSSGKWVFAGIIIICLWLYAAITGFSPSVLRAVTMFSFIALADAASRQTNIYNTLAVSAFVLLLINPYLIMSVGFQLSYLAVLGIVYLQPKIYGLVYTRFYVLDKVWAITAVSIAAQLATFSLGLLYFHQFPTFFLISNLIVIPGAFLILIGGILTLAISPIPVVADMLGAVLQKLIFWINEGVFMIEQFPHSLLSDIYITTPQTWLIIISIVSIVMLFERRRYAFLWVALLAVTTFGILQWNRAITNYQANELTIYRVNKYTAIEGKKLGSAYLMTDTALWQDKDRMRFHIRPNHLRKGVQNVNWTNQHANEFSFENRRVTLLKTDVTQISFKTAYEADILLVANGFKGSVADIIKNYHFNVLIVDGSLPWYQAERIKIDAEEAQLNFYSIYHDGAYQIKL